MRQTSPRGKTEDGYAFLDVVMAMFVITLGLVSVLGGLAVASRAVVQQGERVRHSIEERNAAVWFAPIAERER